MLILLSSKPIYVEDSSITSEISKSETSFFDNEIFKLIYPSLISTLLVVTSGFATSFSVSTLTFQPLFYICHCPGLYLKKLPVTFQPQISMCRIFYLCPVSIENQTFVIIYVLIYFYICRIPNIISFAH